MGLESATTIDELNADWPLGTDGKAEGDDHLRMIKAVIQAAIGDDGTNVSFKRGGNDVAYVGADGIMRADRFKPTSFYGIDMDGSPTRDAGTFQAQYAALCKPSGVANRYLNIQGVYYPQQYIAWRVYVPAISAIDSPITYFDFRGNGQAYKPGGGSWGDISDLRIKIIEGNYDVGLNAVMGARPKRYRFKGNDTDGPPEGAQAQAPYSNSPHYAAAASGQEFIGFVAQDLEPFVPDAVTQAAGMIDGEAVTNLRNVDPSVFVYVLWNALREVTARLEALEADVS